jgi:hypothetical protein
VNNPSVITPDICIKRKRKSRHLKIAFLDSQRSSSRFISANKKPKDFMKEKLSKEVQTKIANNQKFISMHNIRTRLKHDLGKLMKSQRRTQGHKK